jgi:hypothetical protein
MRPSGGRSPSWVCLPWRAWCAYQGAPHARLMHAFVAWLWPTPTAHFFLFKHPALAPFIRSCSHCLEVLLAGAA